MPYMHMSEKVWDVAQREGTLRYEMQLKTGKVIIGTIKMMAQSATTITVVRSGEEDVEVAIDNIATLERYQPKAQRYPAFA